MIAAAILAFIAAAPAPAEASAAQPDAAVPWADIRKSIGQTICAIADPRMPDGYRTATGDRAACGAPPAAHPLERAIDSAFEQSRPLLVSVPPVFSATPRGLQAVFAVKEPAERNRLTAEAYLQDEDFLRAVLPRLQRNLRKEGLSCAECPAFEPKTMKSLTWDDFFPYVSTFVRPDPVHTPSVIEGKPAGKPEYSFHVCSGLAEMTGVKEPDPVLLRAGFVSAFPARIVRERTFFHFGAILAEDAFKKLETDQARTEYLREHLDMRLRSDPAFRLAVCSTLAQYSSDLGVALTDCPASDQ